MNYIRDSSRSRGVRCVRVRITPKNSDGNMNVFNVMTNLIFGATEMCSIVCLVIVNDNADLIEHVIRITMSKNLRRSRFRKGNIRVIGGLRRIGKGGRVRRKVYERRGGRGNKRRGKGKGRSGGRKRKGKKKKEGKKRREE